MNEQLELKKMRLGGVRVQAGYVAKICCNCGGNSSTYGGYRQSNFENTVERPWRFGTKMVGKYGSNNEDHILSGKNEGLVCPTSVLFFTVLSCFFNSWSPKFFGPQHGSALSANRTCWHAQPPTNDGDGILGISSICCWHPIVSWRTKLPMFVQIHGILAQKSPCVQTCNYTPS